MTDKTLAEQLNETLRHADRLSFYARDKVPNHEIAMFEHKLKTALENVQRVEAMEFALKVIESGYAGYGVSQVRLTVGMMQKLAKDALK